MGGKGSGRLKLEEEAREYLAGFLMAAINDIIALSKGADVPAHVRLDANKIIIEQNLGRPRQAITADVSRVDEIRLIVEHVGQGQVVEGEARLLTEGDKEGRADER